MAAIKSKSKAGLHVEINTTPATSGVSTSIPETEEVRPTTAAPSVSRDTFVGMFRQLCTLSDEGKQYIDTVTKLLKDDRNIDVFSITDSIAGECYAIVDLTTNVYVLLMFMESYTPSNVPITDRAPAVNTKIVHSKKGRGGEDLKIIQSIIVDKDAGDYARADRMAAHIYNLFVAYDDTALKPTAAIYTRMRMIPNTNVNAVKDYINRHSPHAVQDRIDWGVVLEYESMGEKVGGYQTTDAPIRTPMLAIGGYTKFVVDYNVSPVKIYPICVISNITSDIPTADILNIAIPVAAGVAISQGKWQAPYSIFGKDLPNLGYFFTDAENKQLKFYTTIEEVNNAIATSFMPAMLAIDIPEGRAHLPQLEKLYDHRGVQKIYSNPQALIDPTKPDTINLMVPTSDAFLNDLSMSFYNDPTSGYKYYMPTVMSTPFINYEGRVLSGKDLIDTRACDYLSIMAMTKNVNEDTNSFLVQSQKSDARIEKIAKLIGETNVKITYRSTTVMLHPVYVNKLAEILSLLVNYANPANLNQSVPLINSINAMLNTPINGDNSIYGGYTYNNQIRNIYF